MRRWRARVLYSLLLLAVAVAAVILGYYTWQTASQFSRLGEQTIVQSTLLLVREKVDRLEQQIISVDNAVFDRIDLREPEEIERTWPRIASNISPSVRAVLVLDDSGNSVAYALRGTADSKREFLKILLERILPDMELERQPLNRLKHLHRTYAGTNYLISYEAVEHGGRRYYLILHHDTGFIVREVFPTMFATEEGKRFYNIVDENNRRVFGPSLAAAGDYLVGHRFPTTLYGWRLQVAPKQAPLLDAKGRTRRINEVGLVTTSFAVILLGLAFFLYAANQQRRLNQLKSDFIANVSHELKTPLSVVRMFAEMLLTNRVQNEQKRKQYLELICRESERLSSLIENVLDFAALERGKVKYNMREGDLAEIVTRAVETFRYRLEGGGIEVSVRRPTDALPVRMDEQAIVLAVVNLLDNAVKYGSGSAVEVTIDATKGKARVLVRDHGPGIPPDELKRVFERFYRTRRTPDARGSGIGLSLVKHIAEAHGGVAWAENAKDGGAIVAFSISARRTRDPRPGEDDHAAADQSGETERLVPDQPSDKDRNEGLEERQHG